MVSVSPYPAQVERQAVVQKAGEMIEAEGVDNLSLSKLAAAFSIKAPSLYRHFGSKAELLQAVNLHTNQALVAAIRTAVGDAPPEARIRAMAVAYRAFAQTHPMTYALIYSDLSPQQRPDPAQLETLVLPLQEVISQFSGAEHSLAALRGAWALMHGFIMLELNGQFRRGGDVEQAFLQAVDAYMRGWQH